MSVKLIDNHCFVGYRVRRTVGGKLYQEYFSFIQNADNSTGVQLSATGKKKQLAAANRRDKELADQQRQAKIDSMPARCFKSDGTIVGLSYLEKKEKSGNITPIYQVGCQSSIEDKVICTSFSINAHGQKEAWKKAIDIYCHHKGIKKRSALYKKLFRAEPQDQTRAA